MYRVRFTPDSSRDSAARLVVQVAGAHRLADPLHRLPRDERVGVHLADHVAGDGVVETSRVACQPDERRVG